MRLSAIAVAFVVAVGMAASVAAGAGLRRGTQTNTQAGENGARASATIASVSAQYAPDTGQFSVSVTFRAPVRSDDGAELEVHFNSDPSGRCNVTSDTTAMLTPTGPDEFQADLHPPSGAATTADMTVSGDMKTMTIFGGDPSMTGRDYRCVTAKVFITNQAMTELSKLTPPLYFPRFDAGGTYKGMWVAGKGAHRKSDTISFAVSPDGKTVHDFRFPDATPAPRDPRDPQGPCRTPNQTLLNGVGSGPIAANGMFKLTAKIPNTQSRLFNATLRITGKLLPGGTAHGKIVARYSGRPALNPSQCNTTATFTAKAS
jgi:hypothetical protein